MPNTLPHPVIVIPGTTASYLRDDYPLPPEAIWTVMTKEFERAAIHPDSILPPPPLVRRSDFEARQPARVQSGQIYEIAYRELIEELRHNLTPSPDRPVPVYPFAYDWRQRLEVVEDQLAAFIEEVIARTRLMRHYDQDGFAQNPKVNLVGHSMGGLLIAGYLSRPDAARKVHRVATLATPYCGSFEAVVKVTTGTASIGGEEPSSREREAARLTPSLYYLLPTVTAGLEIAPSLGVNSMFEIRAWQRSVIDTIALFIQRTGLRPQNATVQAEAILDRMLCDAKSYRERVDGLNLEAAGLSTSDYLCVVGVDSTTRVRIRILDRNGAEFDLRTSDRVNSWRKAGAAEKRLTGDGTVPYQAAVPDFLEKENVVCVTPGDFGYWEVQDKLTSQVAGFHGIMPNMDMLHRMLVRHITGNPSRHGNIWGQPAPGVTNAAWNPPIPKSELAP